ncbi:MAG: alcohol dehydrogenase catalytic domain-containing protein [Candidatus Hydrogenedentes bacterium]|nr:alcohol dehydrogenase catalytic domain-containing protein [Candidatus Hydrogenedentota bacterium]
MKAIGIQNHGSLEQVRVLELPEPVAAPGEVVVAVRAAALNHLDIWMRIGRAGVELPLPHVLGSDASGVVASVGAGVTGWKAGDEVVVNPGLDCGSCEFCLRGQHSECGAFTIVGMGRPGTFAELVAVPARNLQAKPPHLSWEEAAALPLAYLTAWRMLMAQAQLRAGETVLIHGIGGGVAVAALQLAVLGGARVLVTSSSVDKLARASELGAVQGVPYRGGKVAESVLEFTEGRGVDVVVDTVGAATWPINMEVLRKGGRAVHCGVTTGPHVEANLSAIYWKQLSILGSTMGSHEDFRALLSAVNASGMKPVLDEVFPLESGRLAQQRMEQGQQFGKIVLAV